MELPEAIKAIQQSPEFIFPAEHLLDGIETV
jgi:hypothetical protein